MTSQDKYDRARRLALDDKFQQAKPLLEEAAAEEFGPALYALANWAIHGIEGPVDYEKAFELLMRSAGTGYAESYYDLGVCFEKGEGVQKDCRMAAFYYLLAAKNLDTFSYSEVGRLYYWGIGVTTNYRKARRFYLKAAEAGDMESAVDYACMCLDGLGGEVERASAAGWLSKAMEVGGQETCDRATEIYAEEFDA